MAGRAGSGPGKRTARPAASARPGTRPAPRPATRPARAGAPDKKASIRTNSGRPQSARPAAAATPTKGATGTVRYLPTWLAASTQRSKRMLVLAGVFVMLAVMLFPTVRAYVAQQNQISALRDQVAQQEVQVADLKKEQARWNDNAYVVQQARERLKFVKVGETSYTVIDSNPEVTTDPDLASAPGSANHPWYGRLWSSLAMADATTP